MPSGIVMAPSAFVSLASRDIGGQLKAKEASEIAYQGYALPCQRVEEPGLPLEALFL